MTETTHDSQPRGLFEPLTRFLRKMTKPPEFAVTIDAGQFSEPDRPELMEGAGGFERIDDDLRGLTFAIEYEDSAGAKTTRRITLLDIHREPGGRLLVSARCHERKAQRSFRFDRIRAVIDMDGVVWQPAKFFRNELQLDLPEMDIVPSPGRKRERSTPRPSAETKAAVSEVEAEPEQPGYAQRRIARDGLRVLAALSRCDGMMHDAEVAVIVDYIVDRAQRGGVASNDRDRAALTAYVRRLRPDADVVNRCLWALERERAAEQQAFVQAAVAVMDADKQQHPAEFNMLLDLRARLGG